MQNKIKQNGTVLIISMLQIFICISAVNTMSWVSKAFVLFDFQVYAV